jgi:hypothetical protein
VFIHSSTALQPFVGPWSIFQVRNPLHSQYDSLDGGSARRKAATYTQDSINTEQTYSDIHVLSGIRTHDPSVSADEDSSWLDRVATVIGDTI